MASPFAIFRRNQKIMLATVGVLAMVAFVFLDPVMRYVGGGATKAENPVVVETSFGDLTARDLDGLRYQRQMVEKFLMEVTQQSVLKQFGSANIDSRWFSGMLQQQFMMWRQQVMGRSVAGPEGETVETMVLAERAKEMGLVITDEMVNDLIKQLSGDSLTSAELQTIIQGLQPQRPISVAKLFDALRTELLASKYRDLFQQSMIDIPPAQRFEYYSRLNRRAKTEVMPLAVADFVSQVADPSEAELKEFYEKYKNQIDDPTSPEPGFKEPKRATFQYFKANVDQLTEKLKGEVTEEEISKYYEANKQNFIATSFDDEPAATEEAKPESGDKPATEEAKPEADEAKPAAEEKPAEESPAEEKPAEEKPAEEAPAEEKAEETKPAEGDKAEESPQADLRGREFRGASQKFRLVSATLQEEEPAQTETPAAEPATTETPSPAEETPPPAEEKPAAEPSEPAATEPASEAPPEDKPATEAPAEEKPAKDPGDEIVAEPPVPDTTPKYEPLEKVADTIRETLAREKAAEKLSAQFDELSAKMRRYTDDYDIYTAEKNSNANATAPQPLNFAELAEGTDMVALELKSVTPQLAAKEDIGKSFRVIQSPDGGARSVSFVDFAFADTLPTFKPEIDRDNDNNYFLFWKTDEERSYVPPLDQVHDEVVRAWKMVKARELAVKRGQEYAEQASSLNKSLKELFGDQGSLKVSEPAPFSWLTFGNVPMQPGSTPRLSEIEAVPLAGPDFMKTVFGLQPGKAGVALNTPEDTAYVVRVIDFEPSEQVLREDFARENPNRYLAAAREDWSAMYQKWIADLNKEANVKWLRQADARRTTDDVADSEF